jgi:hypothetical protein
MMKKRLLTTFLAFISLLINTYQIKAQDYKTSIGLAIDFGNGATFAGPSIKSFLNTKAAINGEVLFGANATLLQAMYQYHGEIRDVDGLKWFAGGGPSLQLQSWGSNLYLVPMAGLEFKFKEVPISSSFDWRPRLFVGRHSDFSSGRFGLGFKYHFR